VIERKLISKILKRNIIHNYNYLINKIYNVIVKTFMNNIAVLKKKNYIYFVNFKKLNNHFIYNFEIIREEILTSLTNKVERKICLS
jgi:hypothetical protein